MNKKSYSSHNEKLESLKVVSKKLNLSKDKIKQLIKDNEIYYENRSGQYFVYENEVKEALEKKKKSVYSNDFLVVRNTILLSRCKSYFNEVKNDSYIRTELNNFFDSNEMTPDIFWLLSMESQKIRDYYNETYCENIHLDIHPLSDMIDVYVSIKDKLNNEVFKKYKTVSNYNYEEYLHSNGKRKILVIKQHIKEMREADEKRFLEV